MVEAPANKGATQPITASSAAAMMPASGGRSANGSAYCSRRDFLDPERDINRKSYQEVPAHGRRASRAIFRRAILKGSQDARLHFSSAGHQIAWNDGRSAEPQLTANVYGSPAK